MSTETEHEISEGIAQGLGKMARRRTADADWSRSTRALERFETLVELETARRTPEGDPYFPAEFSRHDFLAGYYMAVLDMAEAME